MNLIYTAGCRLRQAALRAGRPRRPEHPSVTEGTGAVFSAAQLLRSNRLKKPMAVLSPEAGDAGSQLLRSLKENDLAAVVWDIPGRPLHAGDAEDLRMAWVREACDSFVVLGGRELIDFCKVAAALAAVRGRSFHSLAGQDRVRRRLPPLVVVPTEAGSGAEALAWADLPDEEGQRLFIADRELMPPFVVLDPELMGRTPRETLASACMDGLCLALEAYVSRFADDASRASAADAVRAYLAVLEPCWNSGGTPAQRGALQTASRLAGEAASFTGPGYVRALARGVVRASGGDMGAACAVLLPMVMEKYGSHAAGRLAELAELCELTAEGSPSEKAAVLPWRLRQLAFRIGMPDNLDRLSDGALLIAAKNAAAEANPRYACPVVWTAEDLAVVLRAACGI